MKFSFLKLLHDAGAVISWPVTHAKMLSDILGSAKKDAPEVRAVVLGIMGSFSAISPAVVAAIAANGLNVIADAKAAEGVLAFFKYMQSQALPVIEQVYADLKLDVEQDSAPAPAESAPAVSSPESSAAVTGPGLHAVVPA